MRLTVTTPQQSYPVTIQAQAIKRWHCPADSVVLCDDRMVESVKRLFRKQPIIVIPSGEIHKRLATIEWICEQLTKLHCDRQTSIIAVGGGVVGDLAGLVANLFMRGVKLYHVPTTVLAMVDSSIGGKNGVDLPSGKNLVGTFYPPAAVMMDIDWLKTLPAAEFNNGMGEVVKHGVLDPSLFVWLERNAQKIKQRHLPTLQTMIVRNVQLKASVVAADERESHQRMLLNLGHTFGHAFETLSDYVLPHGQAVAIGLAYASAMTQMPERSRLLALLTEFNLPTNLVKPYAPTEVVRTMLADKKHHGNRITLVLPQALGDVHIHRDLPSKQVEQFIRTYQS